MRRSLIVVPLLALVAVLTGGSSSRAATPAVRHGSPIAVVKANQSTNWYGYNQGAIEKGTLFHSITANWTVPTVTPHKRHEDEFSSTWGGIGGGCVDAGCLVGDNTLIQAGTEQDIVSGKAEYSAWWEIIPAPSVTITNMTIAPGDSMHLDIHEVVPNSEVWSITLTNVTRNQTFNQTVPYSSTYATAEWINETPLLLGANAGFAALPNVARTVFDNGTVNGANPGLTAAEEMQLVNANTNKVYAVPSAPDRDTDGAALCSWTTSCAAPSS